MAQEHTLKRELRDRYSRQTILPPIGEEGQVRLLESSAVIIGCGALGCTLAGLLARAGVGRLSIVDRDFPEYHNLQRQVLFTEDDVKEGVPKAVAAQRYLSRANSTVKIKGVVADVNFSNIETLCRGADIILDGLDNMETRFLVNDASLKLKIPWVYGGAIASYGMSMNVIPGKTACFRCTQPFLPDRKSMPTCETAGVLGSAPAIVAAYQATEAIKILLGSPEIRRELIMLDVWANSFQALEIKPRASCPACSGRYEFLEAGFQIKASSLCGQSRSVQVVNTRLGQIDLGKLASRLKNAENVRSRDWALQFSLQGQDVAVFKDGRVIIKGTEDEAQALEFYRRQVLASLQAVKTTAGAGRPSRR
jgi:adenylyltransferase/sulfurtransferase